LVNPEFDKAEDATPAKVIPLREEDLSVTVDVNVVSVRVVSLSAKPSACFSIVLSEVIAPADLDLIDVVIFLPSKAVKSTLPVEVSKVAVTPV